jgi:hypothetical protein
MDEDDTDDQDGLDRANGSDRRRNDMARTGGEPLTLALLEDLAAVLHWHGYPPLRGYALAELTASLYRLQHC